MSHSHCKHQFKFCAQCDMVWCGSCSKEWGGHAHQQYWPNYTYPPLNDWNRVTSGGTTTVTNHADHDLSNMHAGGPIREDGSKTL